MKVLHVYKTYLPDNFEGVARVIWGIAEGSLQLGIETRVLSLSPRPEPAIVPVGHHLSYRARELLHLASTSLSVDVLFKFHRLVQWADVVHYHFPWPLADVMQLTSTHKRPSVVTYHSDIVRQKTIGKLYRPVMDRFLASVDRIVSTSPQYLASSPVLARFKDKVVPIPLGIEDEAGPAEELVSQWRTRLGNKFFLFVGALRYYKGLPYLLAAARLSGLPVVIAGAGELEPELKRDKPANVTLVGAVSEADKTALLSLCYGFVFPSHLRSEAFGVSLLEASRAGKPMITCEIGTGTSFVNVAGETGLTIPPADAAALADAMTEMWADEAGAGSWGRNSRARYEALFTAERMATAYAELYRSITK